MRASRRHAPIYQTNPCNSTDRSGHTQTRARSPICHHVPVSIRIVCHSPALHPLFIWPPPSLPVVSLCQPCHCVWQLLILTSDLIWALISYVHTSPRASPCVTSPELDEIAGQSFSPLFTKYRSHRVAAEAPAGVLCTVRGSRVNELWIQLCLLSSDTHTQSHTHLHTWQNEAGCIPTAGKINHIKAFLWSRHSGDAI